MGGMFNGCINLQTIDVSNLDTSNVVDMSSMFSYCHSLEYINLSNFDTRNVEDMFWMFLDCKSLKGVDVSSFDTSYVANFGGMFEGCINLEFLNITNFVFNSDIVVSYGNMFFEDYKAHLIMTAEFYYSIIDQNEYLEDMNVTS